MGQPSYPLTVALIDDYKLVVLGIAGMLEPYADRVVIAEIDTNEPLEEPVDVVLYDSFAQSESDGGDIAELVQKPKARKVVVYTWSFHPTLMTAARSLGVDGYLSKSMPARQL